MLAPSSCEEPASPRYRSGVASQVTILPSGKVGRELVKKRAPPGEANCVVVRHTASDGSKGLHLRAIATMAPGTQLTITFGVGAEISTLRPLY